MKIEAPWEELRKRSIFLATPMYGGACTGFYAQSLVNSARACMQQGIDFKEHFIFNESLIPRARNYLTDEFMRSGCTHLLFVDSDIGWHFDYVIQLLAIADPLSEFDIVCAPYPKKCIAWEKIKRAVDKGFADEDPNQLNHFVGDYVFNPVMGTTEIHIDKPIEVLESGTGFMMIQRKALEKFADHYPEYLYTPDHVRSEHFDGSRKIMQYFHCEIDAKSNRYLSEDYWFCQLARRVGIKVWLCPWMELQHTGMYNFGGSLAALAHVGANPTADLDVRPSAKKAKKADAAKLKEQTQRELDAIAAQEAKKEHGGLVEKSRNG